MKMLKIEEPVNLGHLLEVCINLPAEERDQFESLAQSRYDGASTAAALLVSPGPKYAVVTEEDQCIVVTGATFERPGVWRVWFLATDTAWDSYGEEVTSIAIGLMQMMFHDFGAHRLEVICKADRAKARRWYERHLRLSFEGVLRAYGADKSDFALYSYTRSG
jgi:hypothetical protein